MYSIRWILALLVVALVAIWVAPAFMSMGRRLRAYLVRDVWDGEPTTTADTEVQADEDDDK